MKTRLLAITGLISIGSGISLFYPFFEIMIGILFLTDITMENFFKSTIHVLYDLWVFHIPAFVLIIIGGIIIWKSRK